ncbi:PHB depolymerase family esterase [Rhizobium sp. RU36D]|uniref:extracellular catalytic domain type 1 short-chain-length polyhydroxyalkanoate depolymerase n=1 Tax=Rhizobium sp. RU36D TaxID=1907415 RepID=UPI0009D8FA4B|nr:PHB depolymerase family esterase [Rhizobium sp. RU36D]SMD08711.1 esterase, PHB depolymerase family [Rhizobium sp. RU36D]
MKFPTSLSSLLRQSRQWQNAVGKAMRSAGKIRAKAKPASPVKVAKARPPRTTRPVRRLIEVATFGSNPGHLRMLEYVPARLAADSPLVVVLHGCLQSAVDFDRASGWTSIAREKGFAVLFAEQRQSNNSNLCFNWFRPSAVARDRGELMSIRQMIDDMCRRHPIAPEHIYVQGLSAGGAMASALLATYPERFAGGQIVGGLPFGAARDAMSALQVMKKGTARTASEWGDLVRLVSPQLARRPLISIWHGASDTVVNVVNAHQSLRQWLDVYGLAEDKTETVIVKGHKALVWKDEAGRTLIEFLVVEGMDHGLPLTSLPPGLSGSASRFMLPVGLSAPRHLTTTMMKLARPKL